MATPLGDYLRHKRDSIRPETFGLPAGERRRAPGLRRTELAMRARISVEYLARIEQGRDQNPSPSVINAIADALSLDAAERQHVRYLAKITSGACAAPPPPAPIKREVRPAMRTLLELLEPGVAMITNRLGDVLAHTSGFAVLMEETGLLDTDAPSLTRFVFTDPRARAVFPDWGQVADEQAFDLWLTPTLGNLQWFVEEFGPAAGPEFDNRLHHPVPPPAVPLVIMHPSGQRMTWHREKLQLPESDAQEMVVFLPGDESTAAAMEDLRRESQGRRLRAVR